MPGWLGRAADPARDLPRAAALMERGGTGDSLFRAMYRDFLAESATITGDDTLRQGHQLYAEIAPRWTEVAELITAAGETGDHDHLTGAAKILDDLADRERHAMQVLSALDAPGQ